MQETIAKNRRQKYLMRFTDERELPRPKTNAGHIVLYGFLLAAILTAEVVASVFLCRSTWAKAVCITVAVLVTLEYYLRFYFVKIVECYQHYAKEETRRRCLCVPSCSEYAILCLKRYELIKALVRITKRLFVTCKGDEYKIDMP